MLCLNIAFFDHLDSREATGPKSNVAGSRARFNISTDIFLEKTDIDQVSKEKEIHVCTVCKYYM